MSKICCLVYLSILVSGNILVQGIQEENVTHSANILTENAVRVNARKYNLSTDWKRESRQKRYARTKAEETPYAVVVTIFKRDDEENARVCSGTLVTWLAVLTAAHCFDVDVDRTYVYAGSDSAIGSVVASGAQVRKAESFYVHPEYRKGTQAKYDVAVVKMEEAFTFSRSVQTIKIGKRPWKHDMHAICDVTGFGKVYFNDVPDEDDFKRKRHYLLVKRPCPCMKSTDGTVLCSKPKENFGICQGDLGGGLVCYGVVVAVACGLTAFSDFNECTYAETTQCRMNNTISLFQEVGPYLDWINSTVNSKVNRASTGCSFHQVLIVLLVTTLYYITY